MIVLVSIVLIGMSSVQQLEILNKPTKLSQTSPINAILKIKLMQMEKHLGSIFLNISTEKVKMTFAIKILQIAIIAFLSIYVEV